MDRGPSWPEALSTGADNLRSLALMFAAIRSARDGGAPVRVADLLAEVRMMRVTVWNEFRHERTNPQVAAVYPDGIHAALAGPLRAAGHEVRTATLDEPEHGLGDDVLADTDVLIWWGHKAHDEVRDEIVERVQARVLAGMGLIVLHSAHFSKPFKRLMGTSCDLKWRVADERERLWVVDPGHPIVAGLPERIELEPEEMYGEHFDIPRTGRAGVRQLVPGRRGVPQRLLLPPRPGPHLLLPPRPRDLPDLPPAADPAGDRQCGPLGGAGRERRAAARERTADRTHPMTKAPAA